MITIFFFLIFADEAEFFKYFFPPCSHFFSFVFAEFARKEKRKSTFENQTTEFVRNYLFTAKAMLFKQLKLELFGVNEMSECEQMISIFAIRLMSCITEKQNNNTKHKEMKLLLPPPQSLSLVNESNRKILTEDHYTFIIGLINTRIHKNELSKLVSICVTDFVA